MSVFYRGYKYISMFQTTSIIMFFKVSSVMLIYRRCAKKFSGISKIAAEGRSIYL